MQNNRRSNASKHFNVNGNKCKNKLNNVANKKRSSNNLNRYLVA